MSLQFKREIKQRMFFDANDEKATETVIVYTIEQRIPEGQTAMDKLSAEQSRILRYLDEQTDRNGGDIRKY